jgi:hypothetical protein
MAVALGLSPRELDAIADSEPELLPELARALRDKWTTETELLAGIYELTHANYRVLLSIAGARKGDIPEPLRIPRPGGQPEQQTKKKAASSSEFAAWIRKRNEEVGGG